ncbi:MAG: DUF523 domain-containing protein [Patescibacteria group bacterium]|nr:DUF523 domain-containing protein [Patescibacteria group bacterium]
MKLVSACLAGINCMWNDKSKPCQKIINLVKQGKAIPVCPEQLGGLKTPRIPQEIQGGTGEDVLDGKCKVLNKNREDVTQQFIKGAEEAFKIAKLVDAKEFIAKSKSPSCGCGATYDGTFSGKLLKGNGVTVALLKRKGINVISEK